MHIDLANVIVTLAIFGLIWWLVTTYIPMAAPVKTVINVIAVVVLCLWLLQFTGYVRIPIR